VKNDYGTEQEARALNGLEETLKKIITLFHPFIFFSLALQPQFGP
jgi:hypothetical protein